jgi:hypothetical protein
LPRAMLEFGAMIGTAGFIPAGTPR